MASDGPRPRADWSSLPPELVSLLSQCLSSVADFIRFRAVCSSWRSAASPRFLPPSFPWLAFPSIDGDGVHSGLRPVQPPTFKFLAVSNGKIFKPTLPDSVRNKQFYGSAGGWLVMRGKGPLSSATTLLNPINGAEIELPPLKTYPVHCAGLESSFYIKKISISFPISVGRVSALAILGWSSQIALARPGADEWMTIGVSSNYHDALFYRGRFHIVDGFRRVFSCDEGDCSGPRLVEIVRLASPPRVPLLSRGERFYLVESDGELLLVIRHFDGSLMGDVKVVKTTKFEVFRVDIDDQPSWVEVRNLGNRALFLGLNRPISLCSSDHPGCRENCIYFVDDMLNYMGDISYGNLDAGMFNLADGSMELFSCYAGDSTPYVRPPPLWLSPSLL
ncbi:F-box protein SKIP23 [Apostasia shenzhenica]|uniref:F-box protein SKIP23 n=1 Tax=Apostasia shenzhenica TaxID=1088818 RepID=A0A2I0AQZ7_9ASPA|nr:F-box protein SKIP23 [Apostasia shenzhenica]